MAAGLHGSGRTTPRVRAELQAAQALSRALATQPDMANVPALLHSEAAALSHIRHRVEKGTALFADDSSAWNDLHAHYEMKRINHQLAYSTDDACTNGAESSFSRMRRAEVGHMANGAQVRSVVALALAARPSVDFRGYWQRARG